MLLLLLYFSQISSLINYLQALLCSYPLHQAPFHFTEPQQFLSRIKIKESLPTAI